MIKFTPRIERLIEKHAKRAGISKEQAIEIVTIYFSNIRENIAKGDMTNPDSFVEIYIPKIGVFTPNYKQLKKIDEITKTRKQQSL